MISLPRLLPNLHVCLFVCCLCLLICLRVSAFIPLLSKDEIFSLFLSCNFSVGLKSWKRLVLVEKLHFVCCGRTDASVAWSFALPHSSYLPSFLQNFLILPVFIHDDSKDKIVLTMITEWWNTWTMSCERNWRILIYKLLSA